MHDGPGTIAVAAAVALGVLCLLPQQRFDGPGPARARAEEAPASARPPEAPVVTGGEADAVLVRLGRPVDLAVADAGFLDAISALQEAAGVNLFVNWPALANVGVAPDDRVTLSLDAAPGDTALSLLLLQLGHAQGVQLGYTVMGGVIVVSTRTDIDGHRVVRIYDCIELNERSEDGNGSSVAGVVAPLLSAGGSVTDHDGFLVVRATPSVHREIRGTLALLHRALDRRSSSDERSGEHAPGSGRVVTLGRDVEF